MERAEKVMDGAGEAVAGAEGLLRSFDRGAAKQAAQTLKSWNECSIEEKIERTRQALRVVAEQQMVIGPIAIGARNLVTSHGHGPQGVMKPVYEGFGMNEPGYSTHPVQHVLGLLR